MSERIHIIVDTHDKKIWEEFAEERGLKLSPFIRFVVKDYIQKAKTEQSSSDKQIENRLMEFTAQMEEKLVNIATKIDKDLQKTKKITEEEINQLEQDRVKSIIVNMLNDERLDGKLSHEDLIKFTGIERKKLNRILKYLQEISLIEYKKGEITLK